MTAANLKVNRLATTVGIGSGTIALSWIPDGDSSQAGFIIKITVNSKRFYDSGKIISDKYSFTPPIDIPSRSFVEWSVSLIDENGTVGEEATSSFITVPDRAEWTAKWIDPEIIPPTFSRRADEGAPLNRASYLKKDFIVDKIGRTIIYATAHGIYNLYLNGKPVEGYFLAPGSSYYTERLQVQAYDVTSHLKIGKNELVATIGEGWWRGSTGWHMYRYCYGTSLALLCQLEIDGIPQIITDESWVASQNGPLCENDTMRGETYNAQNVINDWHSVTVADFGYDNLIPSELPVTPHEKFLAKLITTPNGQRVLDFGQNFAGYVEFELEAEGGERIRLTHGEVLDAEGNFQNDNFQNKETPLCRQIIEYTCKKGKNNYHQTKCYFGFRYALIETELDVTGKEFTGVAVYSDMKQTGVFECGIPEVNRLFTNVLFSMKSNFVDVPTDCPHREKVGFTGDAQVFSETALYLMDSYPVLRRWMRELVSCQCDSGCLLYVAPPQSGPQSEPQGMDGSA
ncbi:MAG: family 78 glycoside hydrolase catalytic domain, partial [Clostridia bacterium]|nr:family 78 glycoside hydrolase catalytic domain [Clostridia bacterium]